jgi:hypothetical protein
MIHHNRGNRRDTTEAKVKRKMKIVHDLNDYWFYPHEGQYRKGKIHCSCPMCAAKTNSRLNKSAGPVYNAPINPETGRPITGNHGSRLAVTNGRYGKKNYTPSERRHVDSMANQLAEYGFVSFG